MTLLIKSFLDDFPRNCLVIAFFVAYRLNSSKSSSWLSCIIFLFILEFGCACLVFDFEFWKGNVLSLDKKAIRARASLHPWDRSDGGWRVLVFKDFKKNKTFVPFRGTRNKEEDVGKNYAAYFSSVVVRWPLQFVLCSSWVCLHSFYRSFSSCCSDCQDFCNSATNGLKGNTPSTIWIRFLLSHPLLTLS